MIIVNKLSMTGVTKELVDEGPELAGNRLSALDSAGCNSIMIDLYLLCFIPSPLFHAHWSIFIPYQANPRRGTVLDVRGDPLNGFVHEFERGYIPSEDPDKPPFMTKLGASRDTLVRSHHYMEAGIDVIAHTELERLALSIPAPGPSLGRSPSIGVSLRPKIETIHRYRIS